MLLLLSFITLLEYGKPKKVDAPSFFHIGGERRGPYKIQREVFYLGGFPEGPIGGAEDVHIVYPLNTVGAIPIISFAPGCCKTSVNNSQQEYDSLFCHVASYGFLVALFQTCTHQCSVLHLSEHQLYVVSALEANLNLHPILSKVDFSRVGLMGHSIGGTAAIKGASLGIPSVRAVAAIHPGNWTPSYTFVAQGQAPIFFMAGETDRAVAADWVKSEYMHSPRDHTVANVFAELRCANHLEIMVEYHGWLPGSTIWNYYIGQFMMCHLYQYATACSKIYACGNGALCSDARLKQCSFLHSQELLSVPGLNMPGLDDGPDNNAVLDFEICGDLSAMHHHTLRDYTTEFGINRCRVVRYYRMISPLFGVGGGVVFLLIIVCVGCNILRCMVKRDRITYKPFRGTGRALHLRDNELDKNEKGTGLMEGRELRCSEEEQREEEESLVEKSPRHPRCQKPSMTI